jgi:predicted nucleic acid-binding protein
VYLVDTDVVSELRKKDKANPGVAAFFKDAAARDLPLYLAAVTVGELRRGVELIRHRGDLRQARLLERWLELVLTDYGESIVSLDADVAQVWGRLRVPHPENPLDKQIAATALLYDLVLVTRNVRHFASTGVKLLDPFAHSYNLRSRDRQ